jgi:4'-phosphopantetheinyl transferase EntD
VDRGCSALEAILPASVSVAATRADIPDVALFPQEAAAVGQAVEQRRREFATARACARAALEPWGLSRRPIPMGPNGAPQWPAGIVGSITHCDGYRGCAVARSEDLAAIGIDAEPDAPLPDAVLPAVAAIEERAWVSSLTRDAPGVHWDRLLFSIKEAAYKAWSTLTERPLGFEQAIVSVDPSSSSFEARLPVLGPDAASGRPTALSGRWLVRDGIVLTAVAHPAPAVSPGSPMVG